MYYIKTITLNDIRGFKELIIDFNSRSNEIINNKLIIGKNGTCKTTILRCIAIGLCDKADGNGLLQEPFGELITEGKKEAWITLELYDNKQAVVETEIKTQIICIKFY
ncbi:MAG: AAA family ATPase [Bacteroidetes bacterium]|nr:AAA family ATPase [Bacteroidota bacterium]